METGQKEDFVIYYASQTGTAENFAHIFKSEAKKHSLTARVVDLADLTQEQFKSNKNCVFLMATHYEGDPPDNAASFWTWFTDELLWSNSSLVYHNFTVFALGDTTYEDTFARIGQ
jgi:sulfite reductase alpha subunit-like flavoprotein